MSSGEVEKSDGAFVVRDEHDVDASMAYSKVGDVETLVDEAKAIFTKAKAKMPTVKPGDQKEAEALLETLRKEHQDFATSFPIPMRAIVQLQQFDAETFRTFLKQYQVLTRDPSRPPTREQFRENQGEFLVLMQRHSKAHYNSEHVKCYRQHVYASLKKEDDDFLKMQDEAEKEIANVDKEESARIRRELRDFLRGPAAATPAVAPPAAATAMTPAPPEEQRTKNVKARDRRKQRAQAKQEAWAMRGGAGRPPATGSR